METSIQQCTVRSLTKSHLECHQSADLSIVKKELEPVNIYRHVGFRKEIFSGIFLPLAFLFAATAEAVPVALPTDGLVFHVEADAGVTTAMGTSDVTDWADQSSQLNDLTAAGAPQLVADSLNGEAAITFDGVDDILERLADVNGLPAGDADRTMYSVVKYDSTGYGGVAYGTNATNETFGLIVAPNGNLMVQGWGPANDFDSGIAGTSMDWMIQSAIHDAGTMTHYQDGAQIDLRVHTYATNPTRIVLGAEIDSAPLMDMEVAAIMIYDRVLTAEERQDVEKYLSVKYFGGVNLAVTAPIEGETVSSGDVTVTYASEGKTYAQVRLELDGGMPVDLDDAAGSYTFPGVVAGNHTLVATLIDDTGQPVGLDDSSVTVNFTAEDCFPDDFAPNCTVDTDGDGTPDSQEGATTDTDGDGNLDYLESSIADTDGDGTNDQQDPNDGDACVPSTSGTGCNPPPPPPAPSSGGGSFSLFGLLMLSGLVAIRRRRYH